MRPAKHLLLYCSDEGRRSELAYALHIRGGYVIWDLDIPSAPDAVLVVFDRETSEWACRHIAQRFPEVPILLLLPVKSRPSTDGFTQRFLISDNMVEILDWLRIMTARKRGPRKLERKPVAAQGVAVSAAVLA